MKIENTSALKQLTHRTVFLLAITCVLCLKSMQGYAQVPTNWVTEGFGASPYPASSNYYLSNAATSWTNGEITGIVGYPNAWTYTIPSGTTPTYQTTNGGFLQSGVWVNNHATYAGSGYLQYNNRSANYPAISGGGIGDAAYIATRALDFSGHTTYSAAADTFGFWFWRDNSVVGGVNAIYDSIAVYINTSPTLTGANLVQLNELNTGSATIPRSSTLIPLQGPVGAGWRRCTYTLPNTPAYVGATATSSAYILVVAYSSGGNNMFLDDFQLPEWQTTMTVTGATIIYQEKADVDKGTKGNLIMGIKVTTKGSATPLRIDAATFTAAGSTAYASDVTNPLAFYTGASNTFADTVSGQKMPYNAAGPTVGLLNFGWYAVGCAATLTPATMQLSPGTENYIWLTYDIKSTATINDFVGADFQYVTTRPSPAFICTYAGSSVSTNLVTTPILPQTLGFARQIEATYPIPTYTGGLGVPGFWDIDCVGAVLLVGDNGTQIQNYYNDDYCSGCNSVHPPGDPWNPYCSRWACHPNDYTNFKPQNLGTYKNRFTQVTSGKGVRSATAPYFLRVLGGNVTGRMAVFIDWNKDGDFDDKYHGTTGVVAQDVDIFESYGTLPQTGAGAALDQFPIAPWPANTLWTINVPTTADITTDLNDPAQLPNNSAGPLAISNVRLRIRQCVNGVTIGPFTNGYTEGETEDYTIQVLDNCPAPGFNICKWIGTTAEWNTVSNWCPGIPTINDMAYVGLVNTAVFSYPTIQANTNAVCRQLKLIDNGSGTGAKLNVDASVGSTLTVADDIIIGSGAPAGGSSAAINVKSDFIKTYTIPGASTVPPAGTALQPQTPFRATSYQQKTQIAYTAAELQTTYGWRAGDVIDQISIEVASITGGVLSASSWPNYRIEAFLTTAPVTYAFPSLPGKSAVMAGDANVVAGWPKVIYGGVGTTVNLNMPNATLGTQANGNYYTFNLNANTFVWDGVSNVVIAFESWTVSGAAPLRNYVLYDEPNTTFATLSLNYNTVVAPATGATGYNLSGSTNYWNGSGYFPLAGITAVVSNQRPRLDFTLHRPYNRFDITVGGKFINNNKLIRTSTYSITPTYGIAGDSGFVAGYSKVIFNPTIRATVTTPGFPANPGLTNVNFWNPVAQGSTLTTDIDQEITSGNSASTVFDKLEINKVSATGKVVKQNSTTPLIYIGAYADSLVLTNGEFNLNRKEFTLTNGNSTNLVRTNGWIRSEDVNGIIDSKFTWKIGTNLSTHFIPWGDGIHYYPFTYQTVAGDNGDVKFATYHTAVTNTTLPVSPVLITRFNTWYNLGVLQSLPNAYDWTVDRYWYINKSGVTGTAILTFGYDDVYEGTTLSNYLSGSMRAQRNKNDTMWWRQSGPQSDLKIGNTVTVTTPTMPQDSINGIWVVTKITPGQTPLPLKLINFDAKLIDKKVRIWWDVQSESDVAKYSVERTTDQNFYELIANKAPVGPSNIILNYETYDYHPVKGLQYYRLATYNNNGEINYSAIKPVNLKSSFEIISVTPLQENANIKVDFYYDSSLPYNYAVTDMFGNVVAQGKGTAVNGENSILIPVQLAKGVYFVSISNAEKTLTQKLVY